MKSTASEAGLTHHPAMPNHTFVATWAESRIMLTQKTSLPPCYVAVSRRGRFAEYSPNGVSIILNWPIILKFTETNFDRSLIMI